MFILRSGQENAVKPGTNMPELNRIAERYRKSSGAIPAFQRYGGFSDSDALSGSPSLKKLKNGDNVSIVHDYVGHGIDNKMHEDPQILNYGLVRRRC